MNVRYSQKWALIYLFEPFEEGYAFNMKNWPLHMTIADVFAININDKVTQDIQEIFSKFKGIEIRALGERTFGDVEHLVDVVLLKNTPDLQTCHDTFINLLSKYGAVFNNPEFTHDGFIPHSTIQSNMRLQIGDTVRLEKLAIIDMFPNGNWQQRKINKLYT